MERLELEKSKMAKENSAVKVENNDDIVGGIDINKLISNVRATYSKNEQGLAKQISTGASISKPTEDDDFILWTAGSHWQALTELRGLPLGRITQISGKPDSGKSSHAAMFMTMAQKQDIIVINWDAERKFSADRYDNKLGGKSKNLLVVDTNSIVDGCKAVAQLVHSIKEMNKDAKILIVWDSVGASVNSSENQEESEDMSKQPGISAKETSFAIRKFNKLCNKYRNTETNKESIAVLVINQTYVSIGMGAPIQVEKGGTELTYLSSLIIQLSRKSDVFKTKDGVKYKVGIITKGRVRKNHLFGANENVAELDLIVSADGIKLANEVKSKDKDISWGDDKGLDDE